MSEVEPQATEPSSAPAEELPGDVGGMLSMLYDEEPAAETHETEPAVTKGDESAEPPAETTAEDEEDFEVTDKKPWTKERAEKAHKATLALRTKMQRWNMKLDKKTTKIKRAIDEIGSREERLQLVERQLSKDIAALQHANGREVLEVLSRLTGQDPERLYEDMSLGVLGKRQSDPNAKKVSELEAKLAEMQREREEERARGEQRTAQERLIRDSHKVVINADEYPELAARCAPDPAAAADEFMQIYIAESEKAGYWLDIDSVAAKIELYYQRQKRTGPPATKNLAAGRAPATPDTTVHKSLSPSLSQQDGGSIRELTDSERIAELARDPDFLRALGL